MNQKVALAILLTLLTLSVCFTASAETSSAFGFGLPQNEKLDQLTTAAPVVIMTGLQSNANHALNQPTRHEIFDYIKANPGVHFRGICDGLGLSVGVVQYHLDVLENASLIDSFMDGQNKRYFEAGTFTEKDMGLISLLRHPAAAKILTVLTQNGQMLHRDLAWTLGVSSQALTWQMKQLKEAGLVDAYKVGVNVLYSLNDATAVLRSLSTIAK